MFSLLRGCALIFAVSCAIPQVMAEDTVRIDVTATIAEHCGISRDASSVDSIVPDLDKAQLLRFPFKIDCNTPFAIGVSSQNGALRRRENNVDAMRDIDGQLSDGFSSEKAYSVSLVVATDGAQMLSENCTSRSLTGRGGKCEFYGREAGTGMSSGRRTAIRREGAMIVSWVGGEDSVRRAAGTYQDTLTVVVGPRT